MRRGQSGYRQARELFNPRFDSIHPQAVAYCATAADAQRVVEFARNANVPLALRAGGHSYGGWSTGTGLVLDVSRLARVQVGGTTATVGAGARLIDVYDAVAARGMALAAGSCPTVGIAGLTLGGGMGVLTRAWGLTCDQLTGVDIVTADGRLATVDVQHDPDLFWACRGWGRRQLRRGDELSVPAAAGTADHHVVLPVGLDPGRRRPGRLAGLGARFAARHVVHLQAVDPPR